MANAFTNCGVTMRNLTAAMLKLELGMIDTDTPGAIKHYKCSDECEHGNHSGCGHVLWAATTANPYRPRVCYCDCPCHNEEAREAIDSLRHMLKELKK